MTIKIDQKITAVEVVPQAAASGAEIIHMHEKVCAQLQLLGAPG